MWPQSVRSLGSVFFLEGIEVVGEEFLASGDVDLAFVLLINCSQRTWRALALRLRSLRSKSVSSLVSLGSAGKLEPTK